MSEETYVRLKIISDVHSPEEISSILGVRYDRAWRVGDKRGKSIIVEKTNGWLMESMLPKNTPLEAQMEGLLHRLRPFASKIKALADTCTIEFSCVIYCQYHPALYFEGGMIAAIASLGAALDIDLYFLS